MKSKILIVDDSSLARRTMRALLEELGHTVEEASDGAQALERFHVGNPKLVILDLVMNGMYGLDVLAKLKVMDPDVRVIIVTADIQKKTAEEAQAVGAKGMLNKPVDRGQLTSMTETVLAGGNAWN